MQTPFSFLCSSSNALKIICVVFMEHKDFDLGLVSSMIHSFNKF